MFIIKQTFATMNLNSLTLTSLFISRDSLLCDIVVTFRILMQFNYIKKIGVIYCLVQIVLFISLKVNSSVLINNKGPLIKIEDAHIFRYLLFYTVFRIKGIKLF